MSNKVNKLLLNSRMKNYLESLIEAGEGGNSEFIVNPDQENNIANTLCAFANTEGGTLLIGVKKNGKVTGTEPSESFSLLTDIATNLCNPEVPFEFNIHQFTYKIVVEIIVPKSKKIHLSLDENGSWNTYIRLNRFTLKINSVLKKYLEFVKKEIPVPTELSDEMDELYTLFDTEKFTFTQLTKLVRIKREKLEYLLAKLIYMEKIRFDFKGETILFYRYS